MFSFLKSQLTKIYTDFSSKLAGLFSRNTIDLNVLNELENLLIGSDMGVKTTNKIIDQLKLKISNGQVQKGQDLKEVLEKILIEIVSANTIDCSKSDIYLLVGINGSGKTTFAGKLANSLKNESKKVLLVAGDTFRAAAVEQLQQWAERSNIAIEVGKENQDPASVIFAGCERFKKENFNSLIIDTAGRLQTKVNLMKELEKIKKVIEKQLPNHKICTLLTVDSMLGQNSFEQAKIFNESTKLDGIILTKMDGTGKAGIIFSIVQEFNLPIAFISFGEEIDNIKTFDSKAYIAQLLSE